MSELASWWAGFRDRLFSHPVLVSRVTKALETTHKASRRERLALQPAASYKDTAPPELDAHRAQHLPLFRYDEPSGRGPRKLVGVDFTVLRAFSRNNPWLRAVIDIRKREIAASDWDIVPKLKRHKAELTALRQLVRSVIRFEDRKALTNKFDPFYLETTMVRDLLTATLKPKEDELTDADVTYRFMLALQDLNRVAEQHAAPIRQLFANPNRNMQSWGDILRAVVPDLLTIDQGCIELRRALHPPDETGRRAQPTNPILELHWVDGATVRPCIDIHGMFRGVESNDPSQVAWEQWLDGKKVEDAGWRVCDMLLLQENPQTDIRFRGYGFSRVESLVMTSMLEAMADKSDLEEFKRHMYGGFLNIGDESFTQEDVSALRSWIEEELEGTNKIPLTAFKDLKWVATTAQQGGRDKKSVEKLKRYVIRICAMFELPPVKLGIFESANYNTSETSQDIADDGLRNLLDLLDTAINRSIISEYGHDDVEYKSRPDHNRDDPEQLSIWEQRQKLGIDTPNDTRAEYGKEPTEWGELPTPYFSKYFELKGQTDGSGGQQGQGGDEEVGPDGQPLPNEDGAFPNQEEDGQEGPNGGQQPPFGKKPNGKPTPPNQPGKKQPPWASDDDDEEDEDDEEEEEVEKALAFAFQEALSDFKERFGTTPTVEFEVSK